MKRIVSILLVLSILFLFSCAQTPIDNKSNVGENNKNDRPSDSKILIYYQDEEGYRSPGMEAVSAYLERENATFKSSALLSLDMSLPSAQTQIDKPDTTPSKMTFNFFGTEYEVEHKKTYRCAISVANDEKLKKISMFDVFSSDDLFIHYRSNTDDIIYISFDNLLDYVPKESLSEEELITIVQNKLGETYGEEYIENYEFESCQRHTKYEYYYVKLARYIHGYRSGDFIKVAIYPDGTLLSWSFNHKGIYDDVEANVSKEAIDKAYKYMKETIEDERLTLIEGMTKIWVNYDGEYYLQVCAKPQDKPYAELYYYANLNQFN